MIDDRTDSLAAMASALRATTADAPHPIETRRRIAASLRTQRSGATRRARLFVLALLGLPFAGSALAFWVGPSRIQQLVEQLYAAPSPPQPTSPAVTQGRVHRAEPASVAPAAPASSPAEQNAPDPAPTAPEPALSPADATPAGGVRPRADRHRQARAEGRSRPRQANLAVQAADAPSPTALYQQAHRLHFHAQQPAAALAAWDRYLASSPAPKLYVEALYNRGICLVKLGRYSESQAALRPFAAGAHGRYRQRQAHQLLEALTAHEAAAQTKP